MFSSPRCSVEETELRVTGTKACWFRRVENIVFAVYGHGWCFSVLPRGWEGARRSWPCREVAQLCPKFANDGSQDPLGKGVIEDRYIFGSKRCYIGSPATTKVKLVLCMPAYTMLVFLSHCKCL